MANENYVSGKKAEEFLGVHQKTLYSWDKKGIIETIRTPGNKRMYNVEKYLRVNNLYKKSNAEDLNEIEKKEGKLKLSYVRVSSLGQKDDLERQKFLVKLKYPDHIIIEDIGSGINLNKSGIRKIIKLAISGKIDELVIAYKDRLARFGYELIEDLIKEYSNGKIIIINKKDNREPEEELAFDVLQIMNVFVAKMNGLRKYKIPKNVKKLKNDT
jgi:predicted site-specific integrase-resolvase